MSQTSSRVTQQRPSALELTSPTLPLTLKKAILHAYSHPIEDYVSYLAGALRKKEGEGVESETVNFRGFFLSPLEYSVRQKWQCLKEAWIDFTRLPLSQQINAVNQRLRIPKKAPKKKQTSTASTQNIDGTLSSTVEGPTLSTEVEEITLTTVCGYSPQAAYGLMKLCEVLEGKGHVVMSDAISLFHEENELFLSMLRSQCRNSSWDITQRCPKLCSRTKGRIRDFLTEQLPIVRLTTKAAGIENIKNNQNNLGYVLLPKRSTETDQSGLGDKLAHSTSTEGFSENELNAIDSLSSFHRELNELLKGTFLFEAWQKRRRRPTQLLKVNIYYEDATLSFPIPTYGKFKAFLFFRSLSLETETLHQRQPGFQEQASHVNSVALQTALDFLGFELVRVSSTKKAIESNLSKEAYFVDVHVPGQRLYEILEMQFVGRKRGVRRTRKTTRNTRKRYNHLSYPLFVSLLGEAMSKLTGLETAANSLSAQMKQKYVTRLVRRCQRRFKTVAKHVADQKVILLQRQGRLRAFLSDTRSVYVASKSDEIQAMLARLQFGIRQREDTLMSLGTEKQLQLQHIELLYGT